jgi:hypothetical protein
MSFLTAVALGAAAIGCNCGYQSWRRGPACATPTPACAPGGAYATPYTDTYVEGEAPTLRTNPVPGTPLTPGTLTPGPGPGQ